MHFLNDFFSLTYFAGTSSIIPDMWLAQLIASTQVSLVSNKAKEILHYSYFTVYSSAINFVHLFWFLSQMLMSYVYFASVLYMAVHPPKNDLKWRVITRSNHHRSLHHVRTVWNVCWYVQGMLMDADGCWCMLMYSLQRQRVLCGSSGICTSQSYEQGK